MNLYEYKYKYNIVVKNLGIQSGDTNPRSLLNAFLYSQDR